MVLKAMAVFAFVVFCIFLGILVMHVPQFDLGLVVLITVVLAGYDLFRHREPEAPGQR